MTAREFRDPLTWLLASMVRLYQLVVSPWFPRTCRYYPSCSAFALTALRVHGPFKGPLLAVWRVLRCNPWSRGGVDHVPVRGQWVGRREPLGDATPVGEHSHPPDGGRARTTGAAAAGARRTLGGSTRGARARAPQDPKE